MARHILAFLLLVIPLQSALGGKAKGGEGGHSAGGGQITAARAGEIARTQTRGRVLAIKRADGGYRVKVLTPAGEVRELFVSESGR